MQTTKATIYSDLLDFQEFDCKLSNIVFQMQTTGHYWRNTQITDLGILCKNADDDWEEMHLIPETESDEYDLLISFSEIIKPCRHLIGYNSTSFHIPYLEQKYRAYGLESPFFGKTHTDLYQKYKILGKQMHLSMKLENLRTFFHLPETTGDLETIASAAALSAFEHFFSGGFSLTDASDLGGAELLFLLKPERTFPTDFHFCHDAFYLICTGCTAKLKIKTFNGRLRVYYPDAENYYYLPEEDMAVHKSLAIATDKRLRRKADPAHCYNYVAHPFAFPEDCTFFTKYIAMLFQTCFLPKNSF